MYSDFATGNPVRYYFAITEHTHQGVPSVNFPLPVEMQVSDMEILDSMCFFCGSIELPDGTTSGLLGRFSIEEMLRNNGVCAVDTMLVEATRMLTRLDVSHFNDADSLYLIGAVGKFVLTQLSAFVMAGNYDVYLHSAPWHYRTFRQPHKPGELTDVVVTSQTVHVATSYKGGTDSIGVVTVPPVDLNTGISATGELQLLSLPSTFSFAPNWSDIILCLDPSNNHVQVLTSLYHRLEYYGIYSNYFLPLTPTTEFHLVATDSLLSPKEAVILPRAGMTYILTRKQFNGIIKEPGFYDFVFRLPKVHPDIYYDYYADVPGTRLHSIDRLDESTFVTAGHYTETDAYKHEYLSQYNGTFNDTDPSCMRIDKMLITTHEHPDSRTVKPYLKLIFENNKKYWGTLPEEKGAGETEVKCVKHYEERQPTNQNNQ